MDEKVLQDRISILDNAVKMLVRSDDQIKTMTQYSDQRAVKTVTQLKSRMKRVQNALSSFNAKEQ
jgi:predicted membrane chloride channel (bestrophin family)